MTSLHDDEIETHEAGHRIDPQADTDGDDTDTTRRRRLRRRGRGCRRRRRGRHGRRVGGRGGAHALPRAGRRRDVLLRALGTAPARRARATSRGGSTTSSRRRTSSASSVRRRSATRRSGSSARAARSTSAPTRATSRGARRSRGRSDVTRVLAQWEAGATIVLQALHVNWQPLAVFCRLLEGALGPACRSNAYSTPRGSQGFAVHHDTHDVLDPAGGRREALAALRPAARAAAQAPALLDVARRARRGDATSSCSGPATPCTCRAVGCTRRRRPTPTRSI